MAKVTMKDNSEMVLRTMAKNVEAALNAMGMKAQNLILSQMQSGYGKPIRQTGNLMRDLSYEAEASGNGGVVRVGSSLEYATPVHEGTSRMKGRPYISDGLSGKSQELQEAAAEFLQKGF